MRLPILALLAGLSLITGCSVFSGAGETQAGQAAPPQGVLLAQATPGVEPGAAPTTRAARVRRRADAPPAAAREREAVRVALADDAPQTYTVQRGDTLWGIAGRFLDEPWLWPEIWHVNEQIENPHLIYPGDRISLVYVDGRPELRLERGAVVRGPGRPGDTVRLSPQVREQSLDQAITTIPYDAISPFLSRPTVLSRTQAEEAPYVLRLKGQHLIGGQGNSAYVRGPGLARGATFTLMHLGDRYRDPENGRYIGREALYVGQVQVTREGDPATVLLTETVREALEGDVLLPLDTDVPLYFLPSAPATRIEGSIVEVVDGISLIGQYQIVVLNRGEGDGLEPGHVLEVFQRGERVRDRTRGGPFASVRLPQEYAGRILVFRVLEELSYALVMSASSEMRVADIVRTPGEPSEEELREQERMAGQRR